MANVEKELEDLKKTVADLQQEVTDLKAKKQDKKTAEQIYMKQRKEWVQAERKQVTEILAKRRSDERLKALDDRIAALEKGDRRD
jgi:hypothetical protein